MGEESSPGRNEVRLQIAICHLEQLSQMPIATIPVDEQLPVGIKDSYFKTLERWSNENRDAISYAVKQRAHGTPNSIDWRCAFLAFMESCAVYLRDWNYVVKATELFKEAEQGGGKEKLQEAIDTLDKSVEDIKKLASMWGMKFRLLCDLLDKSSAKYILVNGPYCGAFYSDDPAAPFVGVAFKGTNLDKLRQAWINAYYWPEEFAPDILYGTHVSSGVYHGLFGNFTNRTPFGMIIDNLKRLLPDVRNDTSDPVIMHIAGHSLGGSFSNLCYTQLTMKGVLPDSATLGDLYTFGCPRNGEENFALALNKHRPRSGSAWRIVNEGDSIPTVPPITWFQESLPAYLVHVDTGYSISQNEKPKLLSTEIGTSPPAGDPVEAILGTDPHHTESYYLSLLKALHG